MEILRQVPSSRSEAQAPHTPAMFTGETSVQGVSTAIGMPYLEINILYVEAGSRSRPHRHDVEQVVYFLEGPGVVALDGGEDQLVEQGSWVLIPAETVHMHGAPDGNGAAYVSLIATEHASDFDIPVPDAWKHWLDA